MTGVSAGVSDSCIAGPARWGWTGSEPGLLGGLHEGIQAGNPPSALVSTCPPPHVAGISCLSLSSCSLGGSTASWRAMWVLLWSPGWEAWPGLSPQLCRPVSTKPRPCRCGMRGADTEMLRGASSPVQPIDVGNTDHLKEGKDDEVQGHDVAVKHLEPVVPRLQRKAGGQEEAE